MKQITKEQLWSSVKAVRMQSPLVHNITNYVVMNNTANALLAVGASPVMAHAHPELEDMVGIASALAINIGTLDEYWAKSYLIAAEAANRLGKPWVLDPVGAGATAYRNQILQQLLLLRPPIIRGNASEIMALAKQQESTTKGVDSTSASMAAITAGQWLYAQYGSIICISGQVDIIIGKDCLYKLYNGHAWMARVTGMGCTATALIAALAAAFPGNLMQATVAAMALLGVCGERAAERAEGPGSLQVQLYDQLFTLSFDDFAEMLCMENK